MVLFFILVPCFKKELIFFILVPCFKKRCRLFYSCSMFEKRVVFFFIFVPYFKQGGLIFYSLSMFAKEVVFFILNPCFKKRSSILVSCSKQRSSFFYLMPCLQKRLSFSFFFYVLKKGLLFYSCSMFKKRIFSLYCFISDTISGVVHGRARGPGRFSPLPAHISRKSGSNLRPTQEQLWIKLYPPNTVFSFKLLQCYPFFKNIWWPIGQWNLLVCWVILDFSYTYHTLLLFRCKL